MPETPSSPGMSAANLFSAVTCVSFILSIPLALIFEGKILYKLSNNAIQDISNEPRSDNEKKTIVLYILISGLFHYLNNEVMYLVLSNVHPITLAVGNTMKRVFIAGYTTDWNRIGNCDWRCLFVWNDEAMV
jgi:solute carrier family 35 protein E1